MSKRRRNSIKPASAAQIEWLKHRTGYPSPEERLAIIRLRQEIASELLVMMVARIDPGSPRAQALFKKYGREEVERALKNLDAGMEFPSLIADDARSYRDYRQRYARFGASLKFHTAAEVEELYEQYFEQLKENEDNEAGRLLLIGWRDWEDITPPAAPSRPVDFTAPAPASYPAPINELLEWSGDLDRSHQFENEGEYLDWKKFIPALTRMALDPGLLHGWPSEPASWAPWHAIHALGNLQAWDSAPALAQLADMENDWLSDHLPHIWADMGREVEPALWMILENTSASAKGRGLAAEGLSNLAEENEAMENKVVHGFEKILQSAKSFDPTLNAYLIHFLREMEAVDEAMDAIDSAFEAGRVDLEIITPEDLDEDDDFYDEEEWEDDEGDEEDDEN